MAHCYLAGPLYVGRETIVKPGTRLYGESSFGVGNRLAGEIGESTFGDYANKQHDGFVGHAVLGSWINLGAMTTCSDLKNNYGPVRVDLGEGEQESGQRFVGLMLGDHAKTAIGSLFNTGTTVGFASNIFGGGMPPKFVPNFSWGGASGAAVYGLDQAQRTAETVLKRRGCTWTPGHEGLFAKLHALRSGA
jgi:UDP-N-acetylglucosamine diphosphorylase/glucosamine-1-phosphate N-acetyltransferase